MPRHAFLTALNMRWSAVAVLAPVMCFVIAASAAEPQESGQGRWQWFGAVTPAYFGSADVGGGGAYESRIVALHLGTSGPVGPRTRADLTLGDSYSDNRFETPTAFGATAPWGDMERVGVSASVMQTVDHGWILSIGPSVDSFREKGAGLGDALTYGAVLSATKAFAEDRVLGLGAGLFRQLEGAQTFVFPVVEWALTEQWRISNPLPAGPTGPAGLELSYRVHHGWTLGVGGAYREVLFRLRDDGPFSDGIAKENGVITFLHAGTGAGERVGIDVYAGAVINGELEVQDRNGNALITQDLGTAPIIGATLKLVF